MIIGILNITPDSFSDGGEFLTVDKALQQAETMHEQGADIIDIGGESTRPGSDPVSSSTEILRVLPVIEKLKRRFGKKLLISIDTYKAEVAKSALAAGAGMINTLGGFSFDPRLAGVASEYGCPVILYHIKKTPKNMQLGDIIYQDLTEEIIDFFRSQISIGIHAGIRKNRFLLDPGIGFGKTVEQNIQLINELGNFGLLNLPIVIGVSRKSHLGIILKQELSLSDLPEVKQRLEGALAETALAVINGAKLIRTHDVLETKKFTSVLNKVLNFETPNLKITKASNIKPVDF